MPSVMAKLMLPAQVAAIMGCGDLLAQTAVDKKKPADINWIRTAKFATIGLLFVGPTLGAWFGALDRIVPKDKPPLHRAMIKVAIDQICFAPIFVMALTGIIATANGDDPKAVIENDYIPIMKANYMLWPLAQGINFGVMPLRYQVLFNQTVAVFWNCYLSMKLNKSE